MSKTAKTTQSHRRQMIAILSDVHGNLPALEAVIADAQQQGVDMFWHLGDFIGYGPFVNEVVELLFDLCAVQVIGNYDLKVLKFPKKKDKWKKTKDREKFLAFEWAWETLSSANAKRLKSLPQQAKQKVGKLDVLLTHGGPAAVDEIIGPDTPEERLRQLVKLTDADVILCGHTHIPFDTTVEDVTFINPGSVGRPEGGDSRASYAILDVQDDGLTVRFQRVSYDVERMSRAIHAAGLPANFATMFRTGQNLQAVQDCQTSAHEITLPERVKRLEQVRRFAVHCRSEMEHAEQVTRLARLLFERLSPLHKLGREHLFLLTCASLLHDIGWVQGPKAHNKASMDLILQDRTLPLTDWQRRIVGLIARYHRRSMPKKNHSVYSQLNSKERGLVDLLGGMLRVADGLDRSHLSVVQDVEMRIRSKAIEFRCKTRGPALPEMLAAQKKADLLEHALKVKTSFFSC